MFGQNVFERFEIWAFPLDFRQFCLMSEEQAFVYYLIFRQKTRYKNVWISNIYCWWIVNNKTVSWQSILINTILEDRTCINFQRPKNCFRVFKQFGLQTTRLYCVMIFMHSMFWNLNYSFVHAMRVKIHSYNRLGETTVWSYECLNPNLILFRF